MLATPLADRSRVRIITVERCQLSGAGGRPVEHGVGKIRGVLPHLRLDDLLAELQARLDAVLATRDRMHGLLEAVVAVGSDLNLEIMLRRIVEAAVSLADARYGALGVIGEGGRLAEFVPVGLSEADIPGIDHWPRGEGVLGLLIRDPKPLRLGHVRAHPKSSGFPEGHPRMRSFMGVQANSHLTLRVTDNGVGIPPGTRRSGLGILAERAERLGGTLRVGPADQAARTGAALVWQVPIPLPTARSAGFRRRPSRHFCRSSSRSRSAAE